MVVAIVACAPHLALVAVVALVAAVALDALVARITLVARVVLATLATPGLPECQYSSSSLT